MRRACGQGRAGRPGAASDYLRAVETLQKCKEGRGKDRKGAAIKRKREKSRADLDQVWTLWLSKQMFPDSVTNQISPSILPPHFRPSFVPGTVHHHLMLHFPLDFVFCYLDHHHKSRCRLSSSTKFFVTRCSGLSTECVICRVVGVKASVYILSSAQD
jgi:hypothetical protein